jgi:mono/diheme cytochrome c family protein
LEASAAVQSKEPATILQAIIGGAKVVATKDKPTALAMPAFGWKLSDAEIASLATFIRNAWGNQASTVSADDVAKVRKQSMQAAAE